MQDRKGRNRFSAAAFPDKGEYFTFVDTERDAVNGFNLSVTQEKRCTQILDG